MRIRFHKVSSERHRLEIIRDDGAREEVDCETRSYLQHDLLHYAVEAEAGLPTGVWGNLAQGRTLSDLNDRTGRVTHPQTPDLLVIEQIVGVLSGATKGRTPEQLVTGIQSYAAALGAPLPAWLTTPFVAAVQERMRQLMGRWKATAFGGAMELRWP